MPARVRTVQSGRAPVVIRSLAAVAGLLGWLLPIGDVSAAVQPSVTFSRLAASGEFVAGEEVRVSWTGMPPGAVSVYQCVDPDYLASRPRPLAVEETCQLSSRVIGVADASGAGTATFQVWWQVRSPQTNTDVVYCTLADQCVIRVSPCAHTPEMGGALVKLPVMRLEEDPETGDLRLPSRYRFQRPLPTPPTVELPPPRPSTRTRINGAGGTGVQLAVEAWRAGSLADAAGAPGVDAPYAPRFFDEAFKFLVEGSNDFAISAIPLTGALMPYEDDFAPFEELDPNMSAEEQVALWDALSKELVYIPLVASPLDVIYDVAPFGVELESLNLDARSLGRMYAGGQDTINTWADDAVRSQNPQCPPVKRFFGAFVGETGNIVAEEGGLPRDTPVRATNRSDASESNYFLRKWLVANNPDLGEALGGSESSAPFRNAVNKVEVTGSKDTAESFSALNPNLVSPDATKIPPPGRVGYVDHAYALRFVDRIARLRNGAGEYVAPNALSATATLASAQMDSARGLVTVGDGGTVPGAYPLVQVYYAAVSPEVLAEQGDPEKVSALRDFFSFVLSDAGQAAATAAGYTPLTPAIRAMALAQVDKVRASPAKTTTTQTTAPPAVTPPAGSSSTESGGFGSFDFESSGSSSSESFGSSSFGDSNGGFDESDAGADDGSVTVEVPSALEVAGEAITRRAKAVAEILANPAKSPGLFTLMVGGALCCVVGPILYRRRPRQVAS